MKYKISIVIPVFNVENYIRSALESIVRQTIGFENLEVIMVDDCSTDKSGEIIEEYASKYDNFKAVYLSENSGAAGKPRNVGIERVTSDYIMFLDPDDSYADDACEVLYNRIVDENVDMVFGKYDIQYEDGNVITPSCQLYSINAPQKTMKSNDHEYFFSSPPSIWTKIIKRDLIEQNNILFPERVPAQDLVFVVHVLLKAKDVIFINRSVVKYRRRNNENKSISFNRNSKYINGLIRAYVATYHICRDNGNEEHFSFVINGHLVYWIKQFILSELSTSEKRDALKSCWFLFNKYYEYDLIPPSHLKPIFDLVISKKYDEAVLLSDKLTNLVKDHDKNPQPLESKKSTKIFMLCDRMHAKIGGLARVVLNRSELLARRGYDVSILTIESDNDYEFIESELRRKGQLSASVDLINIYSYYKNKNTMQVPLRYLNEAKKVSKKYEMNYQLIDEYKTRKTIRYFCNGMYIKLKKWKNDGSLEYIDYFDENGVKIKRKFYADNFLAGEIAYQFYKIRRKSHFTKDGFCYLTELYNHQGNEQELLLFDRTSNEVLSFNNSTAFHRHFLTELCKACEEKPYLICDGSGPTPTISNIGQDVAYTISQLHSNPYTGPYCFGGPIRNIGILNGIEKLDAFVTLTEKQRKDIVKQFGDYGNTYTIPNFVPQKEKLNIEKKPNKISIFSRISHEKNLEGAIKAFKLVVEQRKNARLEIFGRATLHGELKELKKIKELISKLKLENNVFIKGHITDVDKEMAESITTLITSKFEGFPMVLIESMLNSTPVISYDLNYSPSDVIDHGVDGFLVEYNNIEQMAEYIIELLDNTEKAKEMGIAARKKVLNHYADDAVIPEWEKLLGIVATKKRKPAAAGKTEVKTAQVESKAQKFLEVLNENKTKIIQKIISKFPSLYILINTNETGIKNALINIKGYKTIKKNHLLDISFYLESYPNVRFSGMDPILHYMYHGFKEDKKPNPVFDGDYYLKVYSDVQRSNLNPLVHYSLYGINEKRKIRKS